MKQNSHNTWQTSTTTRSTGLCPRSMTTKSHMASVPCRPVSVSLLPIAFPGRLFDDALALQRSFNELYVRASNDHQWLESVLRPLLQYDRLVRALWTSVQDTAKRGQTQPIVCGIFRSDYMVQKDSMSFKQVVMNTFSVAGACRAERAAKMHRHVQHALGIKVCSQSPYLLLVAILRSC